jgi:hypothetical protein
MLIKNGRIVDPETNRDEVADILIEEGIIKLNILLKKALIGFNIVILRLQLPIK